jgi:tight adherence protein B
MRRPLALTALLLVGTVLPLAAASAQEGREELNIGSVVVGDHPEVSFDVNVPGHAGGVLDDSAFTVREDGERREHSVGEASSGDLQVLLLIDTTGSMRGAPLEGAQDAGKAFVEELPHEVSLAVVDFDAETRFLTDFSDAREDHLAAIDGLEADGRTATYDAVIESLTAFPEPNEATNQVVILLTDGEDNESSASIDDAVDALVEADVTLHSVEYLTDFSDEDLIRTLAGESGGTVNEADDAEALAQVYDELAADLVGRYRVDYVSRSEGTVELTVSVDTDELAATGTQTVELPDLPVDDVLDEPESEASPTVTAPSVNPPGDGGVGRTVLLAGLVAVFLALMLVGLGVFVPRQGKANLSGLVTRRRGSSENLSELTNRATLLAERGLQRGGRHNDLNSRLETAGISLRPGELVVLVLSTSAVALAVGRLLSGWLLGLLLSAMTVAVAKVVVSLRVSRRQAAFEEQLGETLQLLSGGLRAGYSLMQAIDSVAREADAPAADEFSRVVIETRLGRDLSEALGAMAERMGSDDFSWVMQAVEIHREVGGDLAEVLDTVAGTIRERHQIRRQVETLSAEGKLSAYILLALPFGMAFAIHLLNPGYLAELTQGGVLGWSLIGASLALMTVGMLWMRRLVRLVF